MSESNREKFNDLISQIMDVLIDSCPVYNSLDPEEFGIQAGEMANNGMYNPTDEEAFFNDCIRWLKDEEFIRGDNSFVVTSYGLEMFNSLPECLVAN